MMGTIVAIALQGERGLETFSILQIIRFNCIINPLELKLTVF
ncbi:hypothetical protein [Pleurocapsa sp. FMAR1]|nr:hypothetical protein [Pleurocapsa sp. FMAR1]